MFREIPLYVFDHLVFQDKGVGTESEPAVTVPHEATNTREVPPAKLLLPRHVTPSYYRLRLDPYLDEPSPDGSNFTYKGQVSITIHCHNATNNVSFHAKGLQIGENISVTVLNETRTNTTATSGLTPSASTSAPPSTAVYSNTTSDPGECKVGLLTAPTDTREVPGSIPGATKFSA
jgi:hypothetical protein